MESELFLLVIETQLTPSDEELIRGIVFPRNKTIFNFYGTRITIPANAIIYQRETEGVYIIITFDVLHISVGTVAPVVNFIANNLQSYINDVSLRYENIIPYTVKLCTQRCI